MSQQDTHGFSFRPATNKDGSIVLSIMTEILLKYGLKQIQQPTDTIDDDLSDIEKNYFANHGHFEVVEHNDEIVGSFGIYRISESMCELRKMYLKEECRGKGLGRQMLERALDKAKELGYEQCELETATVLKEAIALYEKFGFREVKPQGQLCSRCDLLMIKDL